MNTRQIKSLLEQTKVLTDTSKELQKAKKESFNLFEILRIGHLEEATHSAFIAELLNPLGSHLLGNRFFILFLEAIGFKNDFDIDNYEVQMEKYIGPVTYGKDENNYEDSSGGKIDILIRDKTSGTVICIENKIYAGDQQEQLLRYYQYSKNNGFLYYLTLFGSEACDISTKRKLNTDEEYILISYRNTIFDWLNKCLKEAADHPILRESIKQYLILIKKLTNLMEDKEQEKLNELIWANLEEAEKIRDNFNAAIESRKNKIRSAVIIGLENRCTEFDIIEGEPVNKTYAQIWIKPKDSRKDDYMFGIESFGSGGNIGGNFFVGIFKLEPKEGDFRFIGQSEFDSPYWKISEIIEFEGKPIVFSNIKFLKEINDANKFDDLVQCICDSTIEFIDKNKEQLEKANKANELKLA